MRQTLMEWWFSVGNIIIFIFCDPVPCRQQLRLFVAAIIRIRILNSQAATHRKIKTINACNFYTGIGKWRATYYEMIDTIIVIKQWNILSNCNFTLDTVYGL